MQVDGLPAIIVQDLDVVAVEFLELGVLQHPVAGGVDRRADGRGEVDALVQLHEAEHRVFAHPEGGADAGRLHWRTHEGADDRAAVAIEPAGRLAGG